MTQKTKLDLLEKKYERVKPWKPPNYRIFKAGRETLIYLWRVVKTLEYIKKDGPYTDVNWIVEAIPEPPVILELAEIVNRVNNVEIQWEELEE